MKLAGSPDENPYPPFSIERVEWDEGYEKGSALCLVENQNLSEEQIERMLK